MSEAISLLHSFVFSFTTQITLCELLLCIRLPQRPHFLLRLLLFVPFCIVPTLVHRLTGSIFYQLPFFRIGWFAYSFLVLFALSTLLCWFCFAVRYMRILFYCTAAYLLQNFIYTLRCMIELLNPAWESSLLWLFGEMILLGTLLFLSYYFLGTRLHRNQVDVNNVPLLIIALSTLVVINVMNYWVYSFSYVNPATFLYELICCVLLFVIQFNLLDRSVMLREQMVMAELYSASERQQRMSQESVEIINHKCHDLKHQISMIRHMNSAAEIERNLSEVESAIMIYDGIAKTGNDALDAILSEKGLLCRQYGICFSCIADGAGLDFMEASDLYALFGNALDNMIESVSKEQPQNRIASLLIAPKNGFLTIVLDNYCSREIQFINGFPKTTKEDNGYHGFGTRSMQYIVRKYGGTMTMRQDADTHRFILSIMFS